MQTRVLLIFTCLVTTITTVSPADGEEKSTRDILREARRLAEERRNIEPQLIALLQAEMEQTDAEGLARQKEAVELLGHLGTERAASVLVAVLNKRFKPFPRDVFVRTSEGHSPPTPAMEALSALGSLAAEPLVDALAKETHLVLLGDKMQALQMLPCKELVLAVLVRRFKQEKDAQVKERFNALHIFMTGKDIKSGEGEKDK